MLKRLLTMVCQVTDRGSNDLRYPRMSLSGGKFGAWVHSRPELRQEVDCAEKWALPCQQDPPPSSLEVKARKQGLWPADWSQGAGGLEGGGLWGHGQPMSSYCSAGTLFTVKGAQGGCDTEVEEEMCVCLPSRFSHVRLCDPVDCSPPGSSGHGDSPGENTILE